MERGIHIIDTTMRDGSHAVRHQFTKSQVEEIAGGLDSAGTEYIEISHGDGLAGSSINYGTSLVSEMELIASAKAVCKNAEIAALLIPGIGTIRDMEKAAEAGAVMIRFATHVTEANVALQHIKAAKRMGLKTAGFLMMSHMAEPEKILEQARIFEDAGVDYVNLADSAGYLLPDGVRARCSLLSEKLSIPVGFHAHNNLGMALANSIAAIESGAVYLDATCRGLGAGAGNAQHEILSCILQRKGYSTGEDYKKLLELSEKSVDPVMQRPQTIDNDSIMLGYAGVYSSFLLHIKRASERFKVDSFDIISELGKRKIVGGQEDMITDVAYQLANQ